MCWGSLDCKEETNKVRVRFRKGGKRYARAELHLTYEASLTDATKVTFAWTTTRDRTLRHTVIDEKSANWTIATGTKVTTRWVEMEAVPAR